MNSEANQPRFLSLGRMRRSSTRSGCQQNSVRISRRDKHTLSTIRDFAVTNIHLPDTRVCYAQLSERRLSLNHLHVGRHDGADGSKQCIEYTRLASDISSSIVIGNALSKDLVREDATQRDVERQRSLSQGNLDRLDAQKRLSSG